MVPRRSRNQLAMALLAASRPIEAPLRRLAFVFRNKKAKTSAAALGTLTAGSDTCPGLSAEIAMA